MVEISFPIQVWMLIIMAVIISGKIVQQGGVSYARGERWILTTSIGVMLQLAVIFTLVFRALHTAEFGQ